MLLYFTQYKLKSYQYAIQQCINRFIHAKPDRKHPFGYGRIEYLTAIIISVIVLYAGLTSLIESIDGVIHPETPNYSAVSLNHRSS